MPVESARTRSPPEPDETALAFRAPSNDHDAVPS